MNHTRTHIMHVPIGLKQFQRPTACTKPAPDETRRNGWDVLLGAFLGPAHHRATRATESGFSRSMKHFSTVHRAIPVFACLSPEHTLYYCTYRVTYTDTLRSFVMWWWWKLAEIKLCFLCFCCLVFASTALRSVGVCNFVLIPHYNDTFFGSFK